LKRAIDIGPVCHVLQCMKAKDVSSHDRISRISEIYLPLQCWADPEVSKFR